MSLLLSVVLLAGGCAGAESEPSRGGGPGGRPGGGPGGGGAPIPAVEAVQAQYGSLPLEARMSGRVRAENQVAIFPEISAPVMRVAVENGDYVEAGAPLVYLRDTQFREQLQQAEAALQISEAEAKRAEAVLREQRSRLERVEELAAKQFQSEQELEAVQAQVDAAEATYEQALGRIAQARATVQEQREALRRTVVRAPVSGSVGQRNVEVGMRVDGNTRLFTIGNLDVVRVEVAVTDKMIGSIEPGQTALVSSENMGGRVVRAEVSRISPFLEAGSYSAAAEIDVANAEGWLRPGMFVAVDVLYGESQQATLVPLAALYEHPGTGMLGVYVAPTLGTEVPVEVSDEFDAADPPPLSEPMAVQFREVEVLARGREMVGLRGIQAGDWVVTVGQNLLSQAAEGEARARVRTIPWARVAALQRLQDQDLLHDFMEKQQRLAHGDTAEATGATDTSARPAAAL